MNSFNENWRFNKGDIIGAHLNEFDDSSWNKIDIPHDWSIEGEFDKEHGEGCTGYLLGGIGWYRKTFDTTQEMLNSIVTVCFDGVYNNCDIYINGFYLGFHSYGYSPFNYDITKYLNTNNKNLLAIRVDHTRYADSRWYTGSGIYRQVKLDISPKIRIPIWGIKIETPIVKQNNAVITIKTIIENNKKLEQKITLKTQIFNSNGDKITSCENKTVAFIDKTNILEQEMLIDKPQLWNTTNPKLYLAQFDLILENRTIQTKKVKFGIRKFKFDVNSGFYLNGKHELIKGVCLHHDGGLVGAAVPKEVWHRRLKILKDCGCNAIRSAHNPASEILLDLCDEMGFLFQEEFFDEWDNPKDKRANGNEVTVDYITRGNAEHFQQYAKQDLQNTVMRDINHPCIFQWSIGNEIEWTYPKYNKAIGYFDANATGNYFWTLPPNSIDTIRENIKKLPKERYEIANTAKKLSCWVKELDKTRPVIANCILPSASYESGYTDYLDIVGYSYRRVIYDYGHENYADKPIMGTENVAQWHEWKAVLDRPFISGLFLWTGFDYLGEAGSAHNVEWPIKGSNSAMVDYAGFPKPSYYMMRSLWNDTPNIHIVTQILEKSLYELTNNNELQEKKKDGWKQRLWVWQDVNNHWNYNINSKTVVEIYSNCDEVELFLNNRSLGKKFLVDFKDHIYKWLVNYEPGCLHAVGKKNGEYVSESLHTTDKPEKIFIKVDKEAIKKNNEIVHCIAQLIDNKGHDVTCLEKEINFIIEGDVKILGIDNGSISNVNPYKSTKCMTHNGHCLLMIDTKSCKRITMKAKWDTIYSNEVEICRI